MKLYQIVAVLVAVVVSILIAAFLILRPGPYSVKNAVGRDFIYSIEPRTNDTAVFWTHDSELGAYCVTDASLVKLLTGMSEQLMSRKIEIFFRYESINNGSSSQQILGNGCPQEDGGVTMYHAFEVFEIK